jgi:hypothetical protein
MVMKKQIVYLVYEDMGYDGISLMEAKLFTNMEDAVKYKEQLQQNVYVQYVKIEGMELN